MEISINIENNSYNNESKKIIEVTNKNEKKIIKKDYQEQIERDIEQGIYTFNFAIISSSNDKKIAKLTAETLAETLFDLGWYLKDNNINNSKCNIFTPNEEIKKDYEKAMKKMGLI